jgi:hypothetical protein
MPDQVTASIQAIKNPTSKVKRCRVNLYGILVSGKNEGKGPQILA